MELTIHPKAYLSWGRYDEPVEVLKGLKDAFELEDSDAGKFVVLVAIYDYEGSAFVLLQEPLTGELFEVNGSHCSCNGLEGCWDPEPVNFRALQMRNSFAYCDDEKTKEAILEAAWEATGGDCPKGAA